MSTETQEHDYSKSPGCESNYDDAYRALCTLTRERSGRKKVSWKELEAMIADLGYGEFDESIFYEIFMHRVHPEYF